MNTVWHILFYWKDWKPSASDILKIVILAFKGLIQIEKPVLEVQKNPFAFNHMNQDALISGPLWLTRSAHRAPTQSHGHRVGDRVSNHHTASSKWEIRWRRSTAGLPFTPSYRRLPDKRFRIGASHFCSFIFGKLVLASPRHTTWACWVVVPGS